MSGFTGTSRLVRLALRRDRVTLPAWILGMAAFLAATTALFDSNYARTPGLLDLDTRMVVENPGMRVLGLVTGASVGGYTLHRDALTLSVLAAVMSVLAVVRHTRQSEELGRGELLGAGVVGRHASIAAATSVAVAANVVLAVALALGMVLVGQPLGGSLVAGASIAVVGVAFTGLAAVTSQLVSTSRAASGLASAGLGVSFALAALGNMTGAVDSANLRVTSAWPSWLSPIGWSQQMRPFADNLWWPAGVAMAALAILFLAALALNERRDVGRGLLAERRGAAEAPRALLSPVGLVWRLQRGALLGWTVALAGFGLIFGALGEQVTGMEGEASDWYTQFGGTIDLLGAYWASMTQIAGMAVSIYVVTVLLRIHHDQAQGTAEPVLAGAVSRLRWLGAFAVNAACGACLLLAAFAGAMALTGAGAVEDGSFRSLLVDLLGAAAVQLPAIAVLAAATVALVLAAPRWSSGAAWALLVASIVVGPMFGPSLGLPSWVLDLSPFTHVPNAPVAAVETTPVLWLLVVAALLAAVAVNALRRRDIALPA